MTDDQAVSYGREAAAVLGNKAYADAFDAVDRALWEQATKTGNTDEYRIRLLLCAEMGKQYRKPELVLFSDAVDSACGRAGASSVRSTVRATARSTSTCPFTATWRDS